MATQIIGIPKLARTTGSARFRVSLDGSTYALRVQWNQREGRWSLDVSDSSGTPIVMGIALVTGWSLLSLVTDARKPPGDLVVRRMDGGSGEPGLDELGAVVDLLYYEAE